MRSKESKGRSGSDGRRSRWDGAKTCRDHFWHLGWVPQKHEIVSRICCMMHVCCGRQMSVKGNWIRQLQPVLNVVPMAVTATRWAVVIVVTPTGPLPPWPYTKHSWHTAGSYFELSDLDDCGPLNPAKTMQRFNLCFMQYQWQQHIESCSPWSLWRAATVLPQRRAEVFGCLLSLFMPNPSADVKSGQSCHVQICEAKKVRAEAAVMEDVAVGMEPRHAVTIFDILGESLRSMRS